MTWSLRFLAVPAAALVALAAAAGTAAAATSGSRPPAATPAMTAATPVAANGHAVSRGAPAPDSITQCAAYHLCLWLNSGFTSTFWSANFFSQPHNTWLRVGSSIDNAASSMWNYRDVSTEVAQYANGTGYQACIPAGAIYDNLAMCTGPALRTP